MKEPPERPLWDLPRGTYETFRGEEPVNQDSSVDQKL